MAQLIKVDGTLETIEKPSFDKIKELIGCGYIETINLNNGLILAVDEEGKMKGFTRNEKATEIYNNPMDFVVGDVVLCKMSDLS